MSVYLELLSGIEWLKRLQFVQEDLLKIMECYAVHFYPLEYSKEIMEKYWTYLNFQIQFRSSYIIEKRR